MGKLKARLGDSQVSEYQNIQIQRTGPVAIAGGAVAAKLQFDLEQAFEQGMGIKVGLEDDHRIEKLGLIGEAHRLSGIKRRARYDATERFEPRGCRGQRGFG